MSRPDGRVLRINLTGLSRTDDARHIELALRQGIESAGASVLSTSLHKCATSGRVAGELNFEGGRLVFRPGKAASEAAVEAIGGEGLRPERVLIGLAGALGAREAVIEKRRVASSAPLMLARPIEAASVPAKASARRTVRPRQARTKAA